MEGLIMAAQLILGLSILVTIHEFGHYITAKWFKMRVEKFYLFFDFLFPIPSLLNFALFKKKIGDTEYGLGWFPLGGYVTISGMIDENQDASKLSATPEPWEFRAKPAWQRLIVMLGGIIFNIVTGIVIFVSLTYSNGKNFISREELNKNGIVALEVGKAIGLETGDRILKVNGEDYQEFGDLRSSDVLLGDNSYYTVLRDGQEIRVDIPGNIIEKLSDKDLGFIEPITEYEVGVVADPETVEDPALLENYPAYKAGLKVGDKILSVNGESTVFYHQIQEVLKKYKSQPAELVIERAGTMDTLNLVVNAEGKIGFGPMPLIKETHVDYSFAEAVPLGTERAFGVIIDNVKAFGKIFKGEVAASKTLSGPVGIAQLFGGYWDWTRFWAMTGLISMALAFMNLLPIPALDGGHALFLLVEIITGKPVSEKVLERAQQVGMLILIGLMIFTFGNDIFKVFFK
ncbi:MAG: putative zinc metalloprotease [Bacteroidota bacterium]|jgi:regulator of sigma E protease